MGISIGHARLPLGIAPGDEVQVEIRGKPVPATVVKPPFVRNGKILT
jgi:aminomethyltransferase